MRRIKDRETGATMSVHAAALRNFLSALNRANGVGPVRAHQPPRPEDPRPRREAAAHILGVNVTRRRILLVAEPSSALHDHIGWLDRHTRGVRLCDTLHDAEDIAGPSPDDWMTLVSLDHGISLNTTLDRLGAHRQKIPGRVIIVASRMFAHHNMSCDHAAIADASLRLPATRAELALCLSAALTNNTQALRRAQLG
ncbi:MAG: hypothetical protein RLZZ491_152 [Pseudomonadota bacterium]